MWASKPPLQIRGFTKSLLSRGDSHSGGPGLLIRALQLVFLGQNVNQGAHLEAQLQCFQNFPRSDESLQLCLLASATLLTSAL